jgi:hypothetical protein
VRGARAIGLPSTRLGISVAALTWGPLFVLSGIERTWISGSAVPFLYSLGTHARLLVAIPLFFLAERAFDARARQAIRLLVTTGIVPEQVVPQLNAALCRTLRWRDAWHIEAALIVTAFILLANGIRSDIASDISTWRFAGDHRTLAGWWYAIVSIPIFQFLIWRWCVRMVVWSLLLRRIARLDLHLMPIHPDGVAGLGMFGMTQMTFAPIMFGIMAMLVASYSEQLLFGAATMQQFVLPLAGAIAGNTVLAIAPLLMFSRRLFVVKHHGLVTYGSLAQHYTRAFDDKWVRHDPSSELLGSPDIQSLADLRTSFEIVRTMRLIPIARSEIVVLALAGIVPTLPLVLFVVSLNQLIIQGVLHI